MKKKKNDKMIRFLYSTIPGRVMLKLVLKLRADTLVVLFLRSPASRPFYRWYARHNGIPLTKEERRCYRSFRDFFIRERTPGAVDNTPGHLISPCDGWLSAYPITENSSFAIKNSHYRIQDLLEDEELAKNYVDGLALVFRLAASDYHHYCYIDNGYQGSNYMIPGKLHSVQPIACERYPVFTLNRRCWCLMRTEHFGPVVQTEIGALIVGGISNVGENIHFSRGAEKGRFELAGSTIVLLFEKDRIHLLPELQETLAAGQEVRVEQGMWIATRG